MQVAKKYMGYNTSAFRGYRLATLVGLFLFLLVSVISAQFAAAAPPPSTMNFQGRLRDSSGNIMPNGLYNMQFRIYSVSSGGSALWTETREASSRVQVTNGLFSTQLGEVNPLPASLFDATNLYFEITMPTPATATCATASCASWESAMTPRNKLATSAYAFNAARLNGKSDTDFAAASGSANYIQNTTDPQTANFNISGSGKVGDSLTVGTGSTRGVIARTFNIGRGEYANLVTLNNDGGSNRAAFYAASSNGNTFEAGGTSVWSSKITTSAANVGLIVQGASGQTADMLQIQDNTGASAVRVDATGNVTLTAGRTISMVGGTTSLRPASPSEGTMYFDTTTKQLLTYANGKWQSDRSSATKVVAASNSSQAAKDSADFVADGTADQVEINAAVAALPASGGSIHILEGTYSLSNTITIDRPVTLSGSGVGSVLQRAYDGATLSTGGLITIMANDITIENLKLDGNKTTYSNSVNSGIVSSSMRSNIKIANTTIANGSGKGIATLWNTLGGNGHGKAWHITNNIVTQNNGTAIEIIRAQSMIEGNFVTSNAQDGITNGQCENHPETSSIANNHVTNNTGTGIMANCVHSSVTGNVTSGNDYGIWVNGTGSVLSGNTVFANNGGIRTGGSPGTRITGNAINDNVASGLFVQTDGLSIDTNTFRGNGIAINLNGTRSNIVYTGNTLIDNTTSALPINGPGFRAVGNSITSSVGTGSAIAVTSTATNAYLSSNTFSGAGANGISDAGTGTTYANQLDASGKLIVRSSGGFAVQNTSGNDALNVNSSTGALTVSGTALYRGASDSASAFVVQNSSSVAVLTVDTQNSKVVVGSAVNGIEFSANGIVLSGTARGTDRLTVSAEYPGLTFRGDGSNNTGNLTSDFCSQPLSINATACSTGVATNFYQWTTSEATAQDYDLFFKLRYPDRAGPSNAGGVSAFTMQGMVTATATDSVSATIYKGGTTCGTYNIATTNNTWTTTSMAGAFTTCDFVAGEEMIIRIKLTAGQNNYARVGDIQLVYRTQR